MPGKLVAAHLRPAGQIPSFGHLVKLGSCFRSGTAGALALGHGGSLLAQWRPGPLREMRDRFPGCCRLLGLLDVSLGCLALLSTRHRCPSLHCCLTRCLPPCRAALAIIGYLLFLACLTALSASRPGNCPFWRRTCRKTGSGL